MISGVVLFPESTLPLRVIDAHLLAVLEKALNQVDAPYTIGVVWVLLVHIVSVSLFVDILPFLFHQFKDM